MAFVCKECGYRFEPKDRCRPKRCPYCSKAGVDEEQSAGELVEEVEDILR